MTTLAIDTAGENIAVAAGEPGEEPVMVEREGGRHHSERLLALVDVVAGDRRDWERIVVVRGPGSYSGLRVGIATGRGLSIGAGCPLLGVDTHAAIAAAARIAGEWLAVHPAGRGQWAVRPYSGISPAGEIAVLSTGDLAGRRIAGEGAGALGGLEIGAGGRAIAALRLAPNAGALEDAVYLRAPNITRPRGA